VLNCILERHEIQKEEYILNVHLNLYIFIYFLLILILFFWNIYLIVLGEAGSSRKTVPFFNLLAPLWYPRTSPRLDDDNELERGAMYGTVVRW